MVVLDRELANRLVRRAVLIVAELHGLIPQKGVHDFGSIAATIPHSSAVSSSIALPSP